MKVLQILLSSFGHNEIPMSIARSGKGDVEIATLDAGQGELRAATEELGIGLQPLAGRTVLSSTLRLRRLLRQTECDIVLAHGHHAGWYLALAKVGLRRPPVTVVARHHNLYHHLIRRRARVLIDRMTIRMVDAMIASSTSVGDTLMAEGCPRDRLFYATNGRSWDEPPDPVETEEQRKSRTAAIRVVAVGNIKEEKDYPTLIRAFARVIESGSDADLFIAGMGASAARAELEALALQCGVGDRVVFGGWCPDALAVMAAADVLVHSSMDEACPQAVYEAAGLGIPVVATWAGGIRDILGRYQDLVEPGDVEALAEAISEVLADLGVARDRAGRSAAEIRSAYGSDRCGESYLRACRRAHDRGTGSRR